MISNHRDTEFVNHNIFLKENNDLLSVTKSHVIYEINKAYLAAGA